MKNFFLHVGVLICILFTSCASSGAFSTATKDFDISIDNNISNVNVSASVSYVPGIRAPSGKEGIQFINLHVENLSESVIKIIWANSAISYDGKSSLIFIDGQKFIDSTKPMNPTLVPKNSSVNISSCSSSQVYLGYGGTWIVRTIQKYPITVLLAIQTEKGEEYVTLTINEKI